MFWLVPFGPRASSNSRDAPGRDESLSPRVFPSSRFSPAGFANDRDDATWNDRERVVWRAVPRLCASRGIRMWGVGGSRLSARTVAGSSVASVASVALRALWEDAFRFRTSRRMPRCAFSKKKTHTRKTVADSIFSVSSRVPTGADARRPGGGSSARGLEPAPVRTRDARSRRRRVRASETHRDSRRKTPRAFPRERSPAWHDGRYFHHGDRGPLLQRRGEGERGTHGTTTRVSPRAFSRRRPSGARSGSRGSVGATSSSPPLESSQRVSRERRSECASRRVATRFAGRVRERPGPSVSNQSSYCKFCALKSISRLNRTCKL